MNGIHEVTGSIPVWSTNFASQSWLDHPVFRQGGFAPLAQPARSRSGPPTTLQNKSPKWDRLPSGTSASAHLIASLLYEIPARDPVTFAAVGGAVCLVAVLACAIPAARAVAIDPTLAIRSE